MNTHKNLEIFFRNPTEHTFNLISSDINCLLAIYKEAKLKPGLLRFFSFEEWEVVCYNSPKEDRKVIVDEMTKVAKEFPHWTYINKFGVTDEQKARAFKEMNEGDWNDTTYF